MSRRTEIFWVSVAALLTCTYWFARLHDSFEFEPHGWADAYMGLLARSFAQVGTVHLRWVPIQNNLPLDNQPDRYVHWPPLYPILLSMGFRIFGDSVAVIHGFAVLVALCYIAAFCLLVRRSSGSDVAILSLFGLLTLPAFYQYSTLAWTPNAALCAICLALYCFLRGTEDGLDRRWVSAGIAALVVGVFFSWEAALLGLVLLGLGMFQHSRMRRMAAAVYAVAGLAAVAAVMVVLLTS